MIEAILINSLFDYKILNSKDKINLIKFLDHNYKSACTYRSELNIIFFNLMFNDGNCLTIITNVNKYT